MSAELERVHARDGKPCTAGPDGGPCQRCRGFEPGNSIGRQFEPGNDAGVRHGAYAMLKLAPRADELAELFRPDVPMLRPSDELTLRLLAVTVARIEAATVALENAEHGELARLEQDLHRWVNRAAAIADKLGMNPLARGRLGVDVAQARRAVTLTDLAAEAEEERRRAASEGGGGS